MTTDESSKRCSCRENKKNNNNAAFHENAVDNTSKSYPLIQSRSIVDNKTKETAIEVKDLREGY